MSTAYRRCEETLKLAVVLQMEGMVATTYHPRVPDDLDHDEIEFTAEGGTR